MLAFREECVDAPSALRLRVEAEKHMKPGCNSCWDDPCQVHSGTHQFTGGVGHYLLWQGQQTPALILAVQTSSLVVGNLRTWSLTQARALEA